MGREKGTIRNVKTPSLPVEVGVIILIRNESIQVQDKPGERLEIGVQHHHTSSAPWGTTDAAYVVYREEIGVTVKCTRKQQRKPPYL